MPILFFLFLGTGICLGSCLLIVYFVHMLAGGFTYTDAEKYSVCIIIQVLFFNAYIGVVGSTRALRELR